MRLLHTSDWHVGVLLGGKERTEEHATFLEELAEIIREEQIDALLIAGDIFDHPNPTADSEQIIFDFFRKMSERKVPVVLISGNHDSGARIEGKAKLLQLVEIHAFGKPQKGAAVEILTKRDELLVVAALPFAGELRLLDIDDTIRQDASQQKATFAERMKAFLSILSKAHFKPNAVNTLMAHLTVNGSILSGTEKNLRMSDTWTIPSTMLPGDAHYIALGHIHRAQEIPDSPVKCAYSGSPLYIDFGEEKDTKGIYIVEASPGKLPDLMFRPLERVKPMRTVRTPLKQLKEAAEEVKSSTEHLKVVVTLEEDDKRGRIAEEVRHLLPQTLIINVDAPKPESDTVLPDAHSLVQDPIAAYQSYLESVGRQATPELIEKIHTLIEEATRIIHE